MGMFGLCSMNSDEGLMNTARTVQSKNTLCTMHMEMKPAHCPMLHYSLQEHAMGDGLLLL